MSPLPPIDKRKSLGETLTWQPTRPRHRWWLRITILLALLAALAGGYVIWQGEEAPAGGAVATVEIRRGDIEDTVGALGNLQPLEYVDVGTQISGQLKRINVEIGDTVKQGQLVAEIDPVVQASRVEAGRAQLRGLEAQLADKQAQRKLADLQFKRQSRLAKQSATSDEALQSAEADLRSAAAQVDVLSAQIQETQYSLEGDEATLGFTKIYAPMDGTVVSITARQGQTLNANQQAPIILRIADLTTMTVWTQVSEADISRLELGMDAYFTTLGAPERRWQGKLRQILPTPEIINNVVLYTALFDVANPQLELLAQMSAQVFFVVAAARDVPLVPIAALKLEDEKAGRYTATVIAPDGTATKREVRLGIKTRAMAEVVSGLEPGERIAAANRAPASPGGTRVERGNGRGIGAGPRLGPPA